jgi:hypothetical protein
VGSERVEHQCTLTLHFTADGEGETILMLNQASFHAEIYLCLIKHHTTEDVWGLEL